VKIGDELNGFRAEDQVQRWSDVEKWLRMKAIELYPDSRFARTEMRGLREAESSQKTLKRLSGTVAGESSRPLPF
jgi:hypothetical protein